MNIYNNIATQIAQFSLFNFKQVLSENGQKYAKIAAVALAIFSAAVAVYYLVKCYNAAIFDEYYAGYEHDLLPQKIIPDMGMPEEAKEKIYHGYNFHHGLEKKEMDGEKARLEAEKALADKMAFDRAKNALELAQKEAHVVPGPKVDENDEWLIAYQIVEEADALERAKELEKAERERLVKIAKAAQKQPAPFFNEFLPPIAPLDKPPLIGADLSGESLQNYAEELAKYIHEIMSGLPSNGQKFVNLNNLATFLKTNKHRDEIINWCKTTNKPEYTDSLLQSMTGSFKTLYDFFKDKDFPIEKKMEALERFQAERHICVPGRAGLLNDICNSMDEPAEMAERLPWLISRYKIETLRAVVTEVHNLNNIILAHGIELGLPASVIRAAQADSHSSKNHTSIQKFHLDNFRKACTTQGCLDFLENFINSDLPGKDAYRSHILLSLAEKVTDEQVDDEKTQAFIKAKHEAALKNDEKVEKERHLIKFKDNPDSPEAEAEWAKVMKKISLKKDPYIDAMLYANYHFRLIPENSEDNKLTLAAIKLFADETVNNLHKAHKA